VVFKGLGVLGNLAYLVFSAKWVIPHLAAIDGGQQLVGEFISALIFPVVEIVASVFGIVLLLQRNRTCRRFWIVYLSLYCLVQFGEVMLGPEPGGASLFLITGLGWLIYWLNGRGPRELALSAMWFRPDSSQPDVLGKHE